MMVSLRIVISLQVLTYAVLSLTQNAAPFKLPPQSVFIDSPSFAVLGENATFRQSSLFQLFNPTNTTPPFFQIFDQSFLSIIGPSPFIREIASNNTFPFAYEAPIFNSKTNEVFFSSSISMKDVDAALAVNSTSTINVPVTEVCLIFNLMVVTATHAFILQLDLPETVQMTNGGTGPFKGSLLFVTNGRGPRPASVVLVNPLSPNNATVLLDNFFGRQFNSLDDVKVHPSGNIFFTDLTIASIDHIRPPPLIPPQVYRLDPNARTVRVVATGFMEPNGIAFSPDGETAYISDTGSLAATVDQTKTATIFAFDVDKKTQAFKNRSVFAYTDAGIPDGIHVDTKGNVYAGCGDGVQVWNDEGTLLGKFFIGSSIANMIFTGDGRMVILAGNKIFLANIAAKGLPPLFP
ncbi:hypothetical protein BDQ12DRAFT_700975 [Crucibulum laeve]|uniref:SMP-30/Gluconolactonase/LRE-like region domain-containing protein n=1 Tax=Crucibulum laeve TaxID=68775 RepID=A0A5C3LJR1_9AGAR|nr:hypothetical protein BDQ12DRAFT_700975 [Crucibulum laeve]